MQTWKKKFLVVLENFKLFVFTHLQIISLEQGMWPYLSTYLQFIKNKMKSIFNLTKSFMKASAGASTYFWNIFLDIFFNAFFWNCYKKAVMENCFRRITYFMPMLHFYALWKRQKTSDFQTFSGSIEMEHWPAMT